ncbi:MAG: trigger factor [Patescibacteria group bacterium]
MIKKISNSEAGLTAEVELLEHSMAAFVGELSAGEFEKFRRATLENFNQTIKLDGFRLGHTPETVLQNQLGEGRVLEAMAELAIRQHYPDLVARSALDVLGRPEVVITKLAPGNPLGFKIVTAVYPKFTLPDYRAIAKKVLAEPVVVDPPSENEKEEDRARREQDKRRLRLLDALVAATEIDPPPLLIESEIEKMWLELKSQIELMGLKFDDYLKQLKKTEPELKADWRGPATARVKTGLFLEQIAVTEKLRPELEQINKEAATLLVKYPTADPQRLRAYVSNRLTNELIWQLLEGQK